MPLWKIGEKIPRRVTETTPRDERLLEEKLEDWIAADPTLLGEPLLVIGRQVIIPDIRDRLDLLALDPQGNAVIIEIKRGDLKAPVDMQALRYASYVSKWQFEDFEAHAANHLGRAGDSQFSFNELYEEFCESAGFDEAPDFNREQRIIVVGTSVRDKLGSVALWLREHAVDISVIEMSMYREGDDVFLQPATIVPVPVSRFSETGKARADASPWIADGKNWHLEKRCSPETRRMLCELNDALTERFDLEGPFWGQKYYVVYRVDGSNWLSIITAPTYLRLDLVVEAGAFDGQALAQRLGVVYYDSDETLSEKLTLPSSVNIRRRNDRSDKIRVRVKEGFALVEETFLGFLEDAMKRRG